MAKKPLPTPDELRQLLRYEPETGKLFWKERGVEWFRSTKGRSAEETCRLWNARWAGREALDTDGGAGYFVGTVLYKRAMTHQFVWAIATGEWPHLDIDHVDGDRKNNRIENLRHIGSVGNGRNRSTRPALSGLPRGVSYHKKYREKNFRAAVHVGGKQIHLGLFSTAGEAHQAYREAALKLGFTERHINSGGAWQDDLEGWRDEMGEEGDR